MTGASARSIIAPCRLPTRWPAYVSRSCSADPLVGRVFAVADVFDALTHARPYKDAWSVAEAVEEISRQRGRTFDPCVVDAFLRVLPQVLVDIDGESVGAAADARFRAIRAA
jgi:hypothetical protein